MIDSLQERTQVKVVHNVLVLFRVKEYVEQDVLAVAATSCHQKQFSPHRSTEAQLLVKEKLPKISNYAPSESALQWRWEVRKRTAKSIQKYCYLLTR